MSGRRDNLRRAYWLKTLHQWHWISAALCLMGLLLFSVTGITLNHASQIEARPQVTNKVDQLPAALLAQLATGPELRSGKAFAVLPDELQHWIAERLSVVVRLQEAEWSVEEIYLSLPRPGGDAWIRVDRASGEVEYESTDRGWISYLKDLHKGRHTGVAWSWFIDIFAAACWVFSLTGLFILKLHATNRPMTWPIVGLGLMVPLLLAILFIQSRYAPDKCPAGLALPEGVSKLVRRTASICPGVAKCESCQDQKDPRSIGQGRCQTGCIDA